MGGLGWSGRRGGWSGWGGRRGGVCLGDRGGFDGMKLADGGEELDCEGK